MLHNYRIAKLGTDEMSVLFCIRWQNQHALLRQHIFWTKLWKPDIS